MPTFGATWSKPRSPSPSIERSGEQQTRHGEASELDARHLCARVEPVVRRRLGPERRASRDPRRLSCRRRRCAVGGERLSAATLRAAAARWSARRPLRAQALAGDRNGIVRRRIAGLRAGPEPQPVARRTHVAGHRCRAATAQQSRDPERLIHWRGSRAGDRHLGRGERDGRGDRPADRRLAGRHGRLAGDLLHQPAARSGSHPVRFHLCRRKQRRVRGAHRLCRRGSWDGRSRRNHLCPHPLVFLSEI